MLRDYHDFTAILVANDQMALGAISALQQANKSVPEDISVIGYDDYADSAYYIPSLTSVHLDRDLQCKLAVEKLIKDDKAVVSSVLPTTLVVRKSTDKVNGNRKDLKALTKALRDAASILESKF